MKKIIGLIISLFLLVGLVGAVKAQRPERTFSLPENAKKVSDTVYYLGKAKDVDGKVVEGLAFVRRKDGKGKPPWAGGGKGKPQSKCYGFLAKGAKWKGTEPWVVNTDNNSNLNKSFVLDNLAYDIDKWESSAEADILGSGSSTNDILEADTVYLDDANEVYFADIEESNAIAITIIWGIFGGPPRDRELVEWDQVYDDVDYEWSNSGASDAMDFENIATHELGHSVGLNDLYESACNQETMYGYADFGEIIKRDLNTGDITGIKKLYK